MTSPEIAAIGHGFTLTLIPETIDGETSFWNCLLWKGHYDGQDSYREREFVSREQAIEDFNATVRELDLAIFNL